MCKNNERYVFFVRFFYSAIIKTFPLFCMLNFIFSIQRISIKATICVHIVIISRKPNSSNNGYTLAKMAIDIIPAVIKKFNA